MGNLLVPGTLTLKLTLTIEIHLKACFTTDKWWMYEINVPKYVTGYLTDKSTCWRAGSELVDYLHP